MGYLSGFLQYAIYRFIYTTLSKLIMLVLVVYGVLYAMGVISSPEDMIIYFQDMDMNQIMGYINGLAGDVSQLLDKLPKF